MGADGGEVESTVVDVTREPAVLLLGVPGEIKEFLPVSELTPVLGPRLPLRM